MKYKIDNSGKSVTYKIKPMKKCSSMFIGRRCAMDGNLYYPGNICPCFMSKPKPKAKKGWTAVNGSKIDWQSGIRVIKPKKTLKKEKVCKHNWQLFCVPMSLAVRAVCQKCLVSQMVLVEPRQEG